jgi:hypothetical protein
MDALVFIGHSVYWPAGKPLPYTRKVKDVCIGVGICLTDLCLEKFPEPPDDVNWQGVAVGSIGVKPSNGQPWDTEPARYLPSRRLFSPHLVATAQNSRVGGGFTTRTQTMAGSPHRAEP